jgi:class 3 adenylate cyclase
VDFTPLASRLDAREVVGMLDRLFTSLDELVDRHGVEKIKTIGDCYMVAAGVPRPRADHAHALAGLALEMKDVVRQQLAAGRTPDEVKAYFVAKYGEWILLEPPRRGGGEHKRCAVGSSHR